MQLYIVRHGIAIDREAPECPPEAERYLTEAGMEKTKQVAKAIAALRLEVDSFFSSPYLRAMQTAEIFASALKFPKHKITRTDALLPGAQASLFFRELPNEKEVAAIFCFGHAPNVDELVAAALGAKHQVTAMKKAAVAALELRRISPPAGRLIWLLTPKLARKTK